MAHLWILEQGEGRDLEAADAWTVEPLDGLHAWPGAPVGDGPHAALQLLRSVGGEDDAWLVLGAPSLDVAINGLPLGTGIRRLVDRDEIHVGGLGRMFFSTERLPQVVPCALDGSDARCPRCQQPMGFGAPAVCCPRCHVWHHQAEGDGLQCWTYQAHCAVCEQPTALDGGYQWTPAEL